MDDQGSPGWQPNCRHVGEFSPDIDFHAVFPLAAIAPLPLGLPMFWIFKRIAATTAPVHDAVEVDSHPLS